MKLCSLWIGFPSNFYVSMHGTLALACTGFNISTFEISFLRLFWKVLYNMLVIFCVVFCCPDCEAKSLIKTEFINWVNVKLSLYYIK